MIGRCRGMVLGCRGVVFCGSGVVSLSLVGDFSHKTFVAIGVIGDMLDAAVSMGGVSLPFNQKLYISHPLLASLLSSKFSPGNQHFPHIKDARPKSGSKCKCCEAIEV